MIDKTINEFSGLMMQGLANQRAAAADEAAMLFAENQMLKSRMQVMQARLEELESVANPADVKSDTQPEEAGQ